MIPLGMDQVRLRGSYIRFRMMKLIIFHRCCALISLDIACQNSFNRYLDVISCPLTASEKKPQCRFCHNTTADWTHLFFNCENYKTQILSKFRIADLHPCTRERLEKLVTLGKKKEITDLLFCADESPCFMTDLSILCPIVAKTCVKIERDWAIQSEDDSGE